MALETPGRARYYPAGAPPTPEAGSGCGGVSVDGGTSAGVCNVDTSVLPPLRANFTMSVDIAVLTVRSLRALMINAMALPNAATNALAAVPTARISDEVSTTRVRPGRSSNDRRELRQQLCQQTVLGLQQRLDSSQGVRDVPHLLHTVREALHRRGGNRVVDTVRGRERPERLREIGGCAHDVAPVGEQAGRGKLRNTAAVRVGITIDGEAVTVRAEHDL